MSENLNPLGAAAPSPQPVEKKKSWFARHKILTGLGVLVLIGAAASAAGGGREGGEAARASDAPAASASASAEAAPSDAGSPDGSQATESGESAPAGIGEPVQVGDFEVTVTGIEQGITHVGHEQLGADPQGQFVIVSVSVTNTGTTAEYFFADNQKLIDEQGREHSSSSAAVHLDQGQVLLQQINPGNTLEGALLYDIPVDAVPQTLTVSGGMFQDGTEIALQ